MKNKKSLDETFVPDSNELKLSPYERLQSILNENENKVLSGQASEKIDFILGTESNQKIQNKVISKIKEFLKSIDGFIFRKKSRVMNTQFYSRKRK